MERRKRISLLLAITLVATLLIVIATTLGSGRDSPPGVMRVKVLRRKDQLHKKPRLEEIAAFQEGSQRERTFKAREFKDTPLAIRQVRNLQSDNWPKDLEIEVKNISSKPIYCILAYLSVPKEGVEREAEYGIVLVFGDRKYIDVKRIGDPQDPHLDPGHTFIFTIPEKLQIGLKVFHERHPELTRKLELHFAVISFGDGTGFEVQKPTDYRTKKADSSNKKNNHASRLGSPAGARSSTRRVWAMFSLIRSGTFSHLLRNRRMISNVRDLPVRISASDSHPLHQAVADPLWKPHAMPNYLIVS